jgi:ribonucleotide monophosphatase NagD (HAD superfamily)
MDGVRAVLIDIDGVLTVSWKRPQHVVDSIADLPGLLGLR